MPDPPLTPNPLPAPAPAPPSPRELEFVELMRKREQSRGRLRTAEQALEQAQLERRVAEEESTKLEQEWRRLFG